MPKVLGFTIQIQGLDRSVDNADELKRAIQDINKALKETKDQDAYKALQKQLIDLKARQAEVNREIAGQIRQRRAELTQTTNQVGAYRALSNQLNAARARYKDLAAAQQENTQEAKELLAVVTGLDKRLKDIDGSVGQFGRNVGNYENAIRAALPGLNDFFDGLENIKTSSTGVGKALSAGFLAFAVGDILVRGAKQIKDFADEFNKLRTVISSTTRAAGDELDKATTRSVAIAETYKQDASQVAVAANAVAKAFDITLAQALDKTEIGFRTGADAQGDFLSQLREYPLQFEAAGASADEFFQILILSQQEGIYSDKGVDAVKEFGLRIREQTKATRDALVGAFGKDFTDQLFAGLNAGSITTIEALRRVSKGLTDTDLTAEQTGKVLADVFGGPGEDAGLRFIQLLQNVDGELSSVTDSTNDYQTQQEELYKANLELAQAQQEVALQLQNTSAEVGLLGVRIKTFLTNQAATFLRFFDELPATLNGLGAALKTAGRNFLGIFSPGQAAAGGNIFEAYNKGFKEVIRGIKDDNEVAREAEDLGEQVAANTLTGLRKKQRELQEALANAAIGSPRFKALQKELDEVNKKLVVTSSSTKKLKEETKPAAGSIAFLEAEVKKLNEQLEKTPVASAQFSKLAQDVAKAEKDLEKAQEAQTRATLEQARKREVARLLLATNLQRQLAQGLGAVFSGAGSVAPQDDEVRQVASIEQKKTDAVVKAVKERNAKIFQEQRAAREREKQEARQALTDAVNEIGNSVFGGLFDLLAIAQKKASEATQRAFDEQIEKQQEAIDFTLAQSERATGVYKRQLEAQAEAQKKALKEQEARKEKAAKEAAKKEKALAIVQSIIATAISVARALAGPPPFPASIPLAVAAGVSGAAQTAIIAAQPLARGGKVNQAGNATPTVDGDTVLAYLKPGEVVLNGRQQAALGGAPTFRAIGVPGFAAGGAIDAPISAPRLPAGIGFTSNQDYLALIKGLDEKTDAINARVDRLKAVVVSEEIAQDLADGETIRVRATLQ